MKRMFAVLAAALALTSCTSEAAPRPGKAVKVARPALWKVADRDTTLYLFGTIHLLPKDLDWQSAPIRRAMASSHGLMLETVLDKDPAKLAATMAQLAVTPGLPPVLERVPADKRAALEALFKDAGMAPATLDRFETWAVALTLAAAGFKDLPVEANAGAEQVLRKSFEDAGKSVQGLETPAEQLGYFDGLPEAAQRDFLLGVIADKGKVRQEFERMIRAWSSGDTRAIAASFDDEFKTNDVLADALLRRRNQRWAEQLAVRMGPPGVVFVAVGAGHLAGPDSVEALLRRRGFRVTRVG